jgi:hypothetical protein
MMDLQIRLGNDLLYSIHEYLDDTYGNHPLNETRAHEIMHIIARNKTPKGGD